MAIMDANSDGNLQYQYIQDTSLASLDSKTSPLAMLVRTCSQIGADPPMAAAAKTKKQTNGATAPASATPAAATDGPHSASPGSAAYLGPATAAKHQHQQHRNHNNNYMEEPPRPAAKLNFKPYENTVLTPSVAPPAAHQNHHTYHHHHHSSSNNNNEDEARPKSSGSEDNGKKRKSASPRDDYHPVHRHKSSRRSSSSASSTESSSAAVDPSTNPIIRSGLEVMHGSKAFCPPPPMAAHSPFKPAADALAAFRHTYLPGAPPWIPAAVSLQAAATSKLSPTSADCKDPLCGGPSAGCGQQQHAAAAAAALAFVSQYHPMMAVGACPAGCTQCDHQRYLTSLMASVPAFYAAPPAAMQSARPYTCSWVIPAGGHSQSPAATAAEVAAVPTLCGKSFGTSDELLQHIRTHTSGSAAPMSPTSAAAFTAYNGHLSRHLFHHHHPSAIAAYGKPSPPLSMMPPSPYSAFNPTAAYCYPPPTSVAAAAAAAAAYHHHHHALYSPRGDASTAATVSR